ncbi:ethylene-responsive transcription factor ERF017-like [Gastrolobium bilobum]|uniref:ethylene-responsive transcription factor ERF017-like n=1 Tax=Gastrolobium bilobum TaxID=150636 RepID=UPI002AAF9A34|nr:ethylene-responsive transcription factor ERF017-like [Gastrolobium bilobum]
MGGADPNKASCYESCNSNNNTSKLYKGVRKRKWGKWVSEIRLPNSRERIWLGSYDTQEKAARAFDAALYCLRGRHASFNFPDTPLNLEIHNIVVFPGGNQSLSPREIQEVAAKFANDPPLETQEEEEEEPSESQLGANSFELFESNSNDGTMQVDHGDIRNIDRTFLNMLDDLNNNGVVAGSDFGFYSGLQNLHSGELLYSSQPPPFSEDDGEEIEGHDAFSNHSFLWSWNF